MMLSRLYLAISLLIISVSISNNVQAANQSDAIMIGRKHCDITKLKASDMQKAKDKLSIVYGHTSHGSQLTVGMKGLVSFANNRGLGLRLPRDFFAFNNGGKNDALDLHDYFVKGDLGNPNRTEWANRTREYLKRKENSDVNVVMWSWCGQADTTEKNIDLYLETMTKLEKEYPNIVFVYMTGHLNGRKNENLLKRNQQIRDYCKKHGKVLYDFADIESYDMNGKYLADKLLNDNCDYDSNGDGKRDRNWAKEWQETHTEGKEWYNCRAAHSVALNGNLKAYAAWALFVDVAKRVDKQDKKRSSRRK